MKRKPIERTITMKRGGFGLEETGVILAEITSAHAFNGSAFTTTRYKVQMSNAYGPFGASVRFTWSDVLTSERKAAA